MWTHLTVLASRIRAFFQGAQLDRDFDQELESHLTLLAEDNVRRGMTPEAAHREARLRLGGLEATRELHREARGLPGLAALLQDLRYTYRTLRRDAGFATFAILTVGLGIGASSTIFSAVNALLLRPLPFDHPDRLAWIASSGTGGPPTWTVQVGNFLDLRRENHSFSDLAAYYAFYGVGDRNLTGDGEPERLTAVPVTQNFFSLLGVPLRLGRMFNADECRAKWRVPQAALLSYGFWQRRFAADPAIVGQKITLNEIPVTVVGVLPESFDFSAVFAPGKPADLFLPLPLTEEVNRQGNTIAIVGRLKPGATLAGAQAEAGILARQFRRLHPERNELKPVLSSLDQHVSGRLRPALFVLAGAVSVLMLIVCANLANLLLARAAARQKEMAIRAALGAGSGRLLRQMLTESLALSGCGAVLGLLVAGLGTRALAHLDAFSIPLLATVRIDAGVLAFTLLLAVLTGLLFGGMPAFQALAGAVHDSLKDSSRGSSPGPRQASIRGALVVSEIAFACVLLVGAGLLCRSFLRVLDVKLGYRPERAAALRIDPSSRYATQAERNAYFDEALRRVRTLPGIESAGLADVLPLGGDRSWGIAGIGQVYPREGDRHPSAFVRIVSDGYLKAMGIALKAGRDFTAQDTPSSERVLLINETLARTLWPGQNPIGQRVTQDGGRRVVGVVADVRHSALETESGGEMYLPIRQTNDYSAVDLVVRTPLSLGALSAAVHAELTAIDPNLAGSEVRALQQLVDKAVSPRRFVVFLLAAFSAFALLLASLGIYAVLSYSVHQRTQELGIRSALGASARDLQIRVLLETLSFAGLGMLLGTLASWMLARAIQGQLFGVTATDPVTFVGMLVLLTTVALLAGYIPARRASRIDPITALRG